MCKSILAVILFAITVAACGSDRPQDTAQAAARAAPGDAEIVLRDTQFQPGDITVETGTTMRWAWDDGSTKHNIVGDEFQSETKAGGTFNHTFTESGTYPYACTLHPGME